MGYTAPKCIVPLGRRELNYYREYLATSSRFTDLSDLERFLIRVGIFKYLVSNYIIIAEKSNDA